MFAGRREGEQVSTRRAQPARRGKEVGRTVLESRQRRVALERLGNGARTLGADTVVVEAVCGRWLDLGVGQMNTGSTHRLQLLARKEEKKKRE